MSKPFDTLLHFIWAGLSYGTLIGTLTGTLMYPLIGTAIGLGLGSLGGAYSGLLIGLLVMLYNAFFLRYDTEQQTYRRRLTFFTGIVTALLMFGGLYAGLFGLYLISINPFYLPPNYDSAHAITRGMMLIFGTPAVIVAGMTAAFATHQYADWHIGRIRKRKNEDIVAEENVPAATGMSRWYLRQFYRQLRWGLPFYAALGLFGLIYAIPMITSFTKFITDALILTIGTAIYTLIITPFVAALNVLLIKWLNRMIFDEYLPHLAFKSYQRRVTFWAGSVTLICMPMAGVLIGAPIAALIAGRVAWLYAGEFYAGNSFDKDKRKAAAAAERLEKISQDENQNEKQQFHHDHIMKNEYDSL
jgi:hypothetical protein